MSLRCSFCLRNQLFASKNPSASTNCELVQISPMLSVHRLCLQSASGLKRRPNCDYSYEEISREVARCKEILCDFCGKKGATVLCTEDTCINSFHLSCFYLRKAPQRGKKSSARSYCLSHMSHSGGDLLPQQPTRFDGGRSRSSLVMTDDKLLASVVTPPKAKRSRLTARRISASASPQDNTVGINGIKDSSSPVRPSSLTEDRPLKRCLGCRKVAVRSEGGYGGKGKFFCGKCRRTEKVPVRSERIKARKLGPCKMANNTKVVNDGELSDAICSTMKMSFCKEIDSHLDRMRAKKRADRSPLSLRQKEDKVQHASSSPPDSPSVVHGKENKTLKRLGSGKRKVLDTWIVREDLRDISLTSSTSSDSVKTAKKSRKGLTKVNDKDNNTGCSSQNSNQAKKQKEPHVSVATTCRNKSGSESSPAKKFVDNSQCERTPFALARSLAAKSLFATCDKKKPPVDLAAAKSASQPTPPPPTPANVKKLVKKINVEPIPLDQRQLHHIRNSLPISCGEPEAEEDYQWLVDGANRQIDDFLDLNEGEKDFFKLWNTHLHRYPCYGDKMLNTILERFVVEVGPSIFRQNLYKNFILHLCSIYDFGIIDKVTLDQLASSMRSQMLRVKPDPDDDEQQCDDETKPNTATYQQSTTTTTISKRLALHCQESAEGSTRSSRCSTPIGDCGSSISSGPSIRLYLSESEGEEENDEKELEGRLRSSPNRRGRPRTSPMSAAAAEAANAAATTSARTRISEEGRHLTAAVKNGSGGVAVSYFSDLSLEPIVDLPELESGLRCSGTRFRAFASPVIYRSRKTIVGGSGIGTGGSGGCRRSQRPTGRSPMKRNLALENGDAGHASPQKIMR